MAKTKLIVNAHVIELPSIHQVLISLQPGQIWYTDIRASDLTYVKTRYGIQIQTERLICVNSTTLRAERITKITMVSNPFIK